MVYCKEGKKQWVSNQHTNHFENAYALDDDDVKSEIDNFVQIDQQLERTIVIDAFHILHELGALSDLFTNGCPCYFKNCLYKKENSIILFVLHIPLQAWY